MLDTLSNFTKPVNCDIVPDMEAFKKEGLKDPRPRVVIDKQDGSDKLWAEARIAALRKRVTVSVWVWEAIQEKLTREEKSRK